MLLGATGRIKVSKDWLQGTQAGDSPSEICRDAPALRTTQPTLDVHL
jgi:hypothetical protein